MNDPKQYIISNNIQRYESNRAINKFLSEIQWRSDGKDAIIDIGCGSGDVTWDILKPKLPENFEKLVGVDISEEMIKYACSQYIHTRIEFGILNIETSNLPDNYKNTFDHAFSFYCLHWCQNQRQAFQNIYDVLKPGGEILAILVGYCSYFTTYEDMAKTDKWKTYLYDVDKYISPYHRTNNTQSLLTNLLTDIGFDVLEFCKESKETHTNNLNDMKNFLTSVNPFMDRMSDKTKELYLRDVIVKFEKTNGLDKQNNQNGKFTIPYDLITLFARKR